MNKCINNEDDRHFSCSMTMSVSKVINVTVFEILGTWKMALNCLKWGSD